MLQVQYLKGCDSNAGKELRSMNDTISGDMDGYTSLLYIIIYDVQVNGVHRNYNIMKPDDFT